MEKKLHYRTMMFAFMNAYDDETGQNFEGATICNCEWCDYYEGYVPLEDDMLRHFYRQPEKYGYNLGSLYIHEVRFIEILPQDNLLLNLN